MSLTLDNGTAFPDLASMITIARHDDVIRVPNGLTALQRFRRWLHSENFPDRGRIVFLDGRLWIELGREPIFTHNQVKQEFNPVIGGLVKSERLGRFFPDGLYLTNDQAGLASQPDGTFVSHDSLAAGRVRLIEGERAGYVELDGSPDMVLEVISAGSVEKDTETLRDLYWRAGITEYWLVDARTDRLMFTILQHAPGGYVAGRKQAGWSKSRVLGRSFRLTCQADAAGNPDYTLETR